MHYISHVHPAESPRRSNRVYSCVKITLIVLKTGVGLWVCNEINPQTFQNGAANTLLQLHFTCNPNISKPVLFKVSLSPIFEGEEVSTSRISSTPEVLKIKKT